jgi:exo-1,4-beta-D-glucosaminidase
MEEIFAREVQVDIGADESKKIMMPEKPAAENGVYFLKLELTDDTGKSISSNFYWLSTKGDENADFTALNGLPRVALNCVVSPMKLDNGKYRVTVEIENPSASLAFSVNPKIIKRDSKDLVLPVFWEDNYFSLLPKEKRMVSVEFNADDLQGEIPVFKVDGWNIAPAEQEMH